MKIFINIYVLILQASFILAKSKMIKQVYNQRVFKIFNFFLQKFKIFPTLVMVIAIMFIQSCDNSTDCKFASNRSIKINFVTISKNKTITDSLVPSVTIYTSNGYLLYNKAPAKQVTLPLSQLSDTSNFIFHLDTLLTDTLWIYATRSIRMVSSDCGFNTYFTIDSAKVTNFRIKNIFIVDKEVGEALKTDRNISILLKRKEEN